MIEYIIDEDYESVRVDRFLRKHLKNINLSEIYKMLRKGKIKVNNKKISQDYRFLKMKIYLLLINHWEMLFIKAVDMIFPYLRNLEVITQIII